MMRDMLTVTLRYDDGFIKTIGGISVMLPSKSITPFLGIWYGQARPIQFSVSEKQQSTKRKVPRAFARPRSSAFTANDF